MSDILIAVGLVSGIGLVSALLLTAAARFFDVPYDEKRKAIRECLPGINCGACGCKGCDDYAEAVASGKAEPSLCIPGGASAAEKIGDILGVVIPPPKDVVAFVHCNGNCTATSVKNIYIGVGTCRAASAIYSGPNSCTYGCLGFGDCAAKCPADAICMRDGIAHINLDLCVGCGLCETTCPKHIISMIPRKDHTAVMCSNSDKGGEARKTCKNACIGCKKCEKACPVGAIKVVHNLAEIDHSKCNGCGICIGECPVGCLKPRTFHASDIAQEV